MKINCGISTAALRFELVLSYAIYFIMQFIVSTADSATFEVITVLFMKIQD
jgi:hypothetical protein